MAPPTGPRGGNANRLSTRSTTAPRAGGISKRRNAVRTDRDGDVSMNGPAGGNAPTGPGGRGRGGRGRGPRSGGRSRLVQNIRDHIETKAIIKIHGLKNSKAAGNKDGGLRGLLDFLERKTAKEKTIVLSRGIIDGDWVWIKVKKEDAPIILRLNGFTYAGAPLTIQETTEIMPTPTAIVSREAAETKAKLLTVLANRYNAEQKVLDLSALGTDPILGNLGTFDSQSLAQKSFKALVHLVGSQYTDPEEKRAAIPAVSLARNDITDVEQVYSLATSLPKLLRLDLTGNKLDNLSKISKWKDQFRYLQELHLTGNPVTAQPNYLAEILSWFPSLQILDGQQVRTPAEAAENFKSYMPQPIPEYPSNMRDGEANVAASFLTSFFDYYDRDRSALVSQFYDFESSFTLISKENTARDKSWKAYSQYSRNIQKLGPRNRQTPERVYTGSKKIAEIWNSLPATRHPILAEAVTWIVDCHTFPGIADPNNPSQFAMGLVINVNGSFEEADTTQNLFGVRKFSRNFILGPSLPGAPYPYRVISDHYTVYGWKPYPPGTVVAPIAPPATVTTTAPAIAPVTTEISPGAARVDDVTKTQMIQELSRITGMTAEYSQLCLSGAADWNWEMALKSFEETKAALPANAFIAA
ncbi:putative mRNA export factor mex67 [Podospora fimiseda]|uniref:mRNA export factor MEX67 n=1 Tax=Podospora fimiseda TaxID=252190 RepID=A0AAN7BWH4_9PEZI|nr:putative mRNA export factor mex67 [Podospora fimiseda]